jgi:ammonia channel protein AmtB
VTVSGALGIGLGAALICFFFVAYVKPRLGYDDSLDAFGVHGVGGIWGALATGLWATKSVNSAMPLDWPSRLPHTTRLGSFGSLPLSFCKGWVVNGKRRRF